MRTHRYEEYTETRTRTVETLTCNQCGEITDITPTTRPEGWITVFRQIDGRNATWDFCPGDCFTLWACQLDELTGSYLEPWRETVDILTAEKEMAK
jgi:hypothetical protein